MYKHFRLNRRILGALASLLLILGIGATVAIGAGPVVLAGDQNIEVSNDGGTNASEAFGYTATASGTATSITVYLRSTTGVQVGLYADNASKPGARLGTGSVASNTVGWVTVPVSGNATIVSGTRYWLAIAANAGKTVTYRDKDNVGSTLDYSGTGLANPYTITANWNSNPASVYLSGNTGAAAPTAAFTFSPASPTTGQAVTLSGTGSTCNATPCTYKYIDTTNGAVLGTSQTSTFTFQNVGTKHAQLTVTDALGQTGVVAHDIVVSAPAAVPPSNTSPPTISGTPQQGQTLTANPGTWTGDAPITYTYAWSDGATGQTDTLTAADVGQNVSVTVTASNGAGSAQATSASVGPVTAASGGGTVPCALTHAAGADPNTSCWATHTGVLGGTGITEAQIEANPAAVGFTKHTGELVISAPNTTIDHMWVDGCITIADGADNTVVKNTLVTFTCNASGDNAGGSAVNTGQGPNIAKNTLVEDTTIDGGNATFGAHTAAITLDGGEALRVNVFGFAQGFISDSNTAAAPALFQDDYGHDYRGCSHDDGTWFDSSSYVTFEHGWIWTNDATQQGTEGCATAALAGGSDFGPQNHITYDSSYGDGATGENIHTGCGSTQMTITNNALDNEAAKNSSDGGYQSLTGNTWSGNYSVDVSTGANLGPWGPFSSGC